jgi:DNA polymerase V
VQNEDLLYKLFGVNAELLIDHAWGYEPCTIADIKAYKPSSRSLCSGQVLHSPYRVESARIILREMCDALVLSMVDKGVATSQATLTVGYDSESLTRPGIKYLGEVTTDFYGRMTPKHAHGSVNFKRHTSSTKEITKGLIALYDRIIDPNLLVRRINISVGNLESESVRQTEGGGEQLDFFTSYSEAEEKEKAEEKSYKIEKKQQAAVLAIKKKFGGNSIIRGTSLEEGATAIDRNSQIGGHRA